MLHTELKTNGRVLPQPCPLEAQTADTLRGSARNGSVRDAGMQLARGESSGGAKPEPSPAKAEYGVSRVFVLDKKMQPLMPCHPARARSLLSQGKAVVVRRFPFTIRLKDRVGGDAQPLRIKIDPGAKTTGVAVVREQGASQHVLHLGELTHFQTGDMVRAIVPKGKNAGIHVGRVAVRASGNFNIKVRAKTITDVGWKYCRIISKSDGYGYSRAALPLPPEGRSPGTEE